MLSKFLSTKVTNVGTVAAGATLPALLELAVKSYIVKDYPSLLSALFGILGALLTAKDSAAARKQ